MEAQADQFGVLAAQKLMGGAVGEDEFALPIGLDQGDGNGVQSLEQSFLGIVGDALDQIKLIRGADVARAVAESEPQGDEAHDPAHGGDGAQHPHPVNLAFEKHATRLSRSGATRACPGDTLQTANRTGPLSPLRRPSRDGTRRPAWPCRIGTRSDLVQAVRALRRSIAPRTVMPIGISQ